MIKKFSIGKISKPHGVKGEVNVIPFDEDLNIFKKIDSVFLSSSDVNEDDLREVKIQSVKFKNTKVVIKFKEFNSCDEVEFLRNKFIRIGREEIPLKEGDYFIADIKECAVYDEHQKFLGKVYDVIKTKNNDVYWIKKTQLNDELLIPVLKSIVLSIDIDERKIIIRELSSWC